VHPAPVTYAELVQKNTEFGKAIKEVAPNALVAGFVSYGFNGFESLQDAPDASQHGNFIEYYLTQMKQAEQAAGKRIVDLLDLLVKFTPRGITGDDTTPPRSMHAYRRRVHCGTRAMTKAAGSPATSAGRSA
jgi:hypothetical protein